MEAIIIHPRNKKQFTALKAIFEEMKIPFEKARIERSSSFEQIGKSPQESPYDPEFVAKVKRGEEAARKMKGLKVNVDTLWK